MHATFLAIVPSPVWPLELIATAKARPDLGVTIPRESLFLPLLGPTEVRTKSSLVSVWGKQILTTFTTSLFSHACERQRHAHHVAVFFFGTQHCLLAAMRARARDQLPALGRDTWIVTHALA